jgi:hypothetical protein
MVIQAPPRGVDREPEIASRAHCSPPSVAAAVLSVADEGALSACQVWITKASASEPPMKCRKRIGDIQYRGRVIAPRRAWREPADWPGGCPAWMMARAWCGLLCGTPEPLAPRPRAASGASIGPRSVVEARTQQQIWEGRVVMRGTGDGVRLAGSARGRGRSALAHEHDAVGKVGA